MKIIFSRKGYDSESGGIPSPIFPDGTFCSLPIPSDQQPCLEDISFNDMCLGTIVKHLKKQVKKQGGVRKNGVHLDPDLDVDAIPRKRGWRPCFGQVGAAQTHLETFEIDKGDLFLFFGWFRPVEIHNGELRFQHNEPDMHALFGWLQVGEIYHPGKRGFEPPSWAANHPHITDADYYSKKYSNNTLYVAAEHLQIPGMRKHIAGGGVFKYFDQRLCLTEPGKSRSIWRLPSWFYPSKGIPPLSYHVDMKRLHKDKKGVLLKTVARGQEFLLDCSFYPEAMNWLREIFNILSIHRSEYFGIVIKKSK